MDISIEKKLIRKRKRLVKQLQEYDLKNANSKYTYEGGRSIGLLQGKISAIEDTLDLINENWENKKEI